VPSASAAPQVPPLQSEHVVDESYAGRYRTDAIVLNFGPTDARACFGPMTASVPPHCLSPGTSGWLELPGWSWKGLVPAGGSTLYGAFALVGHYGGSTFTLTEPAKPSTSAPLWLGRRPPMSSPCPEPTGGWTPVDPSRATADSWSLAAEHAQRETGFGASWIDERDPNGVPDNRLPDPKTFVLNVSTTGDLAAMQTAVRQIWGGALCVSRAAYTGVALANAQRALTNRPGILQIYLDGRTSQLEVTVIRATVQRQRELDREFGPGTIRQYGALAPLD